jgi:hypothetical protein
MEEKQRQPEAAAATVVVTEAAATPILRLRGAPAAPAGPRVTWTADTVEINEYSGKKKSKSELFVVNTARPQWTEAFPFCFRAKPAATAAVCAAAEPRATPSSSVVVV